MVAQHCECTGCHWLCNLKNGTFCYYKKKAESLQNIEFQLLLGCFIFSCLTWTYLQLLSLCINLLSGNWQCQVYFTFDVLTISHVSLPSYLSHFKPDPRRCWDAGGSGWLWTAKEFSCPQKCQRIHRFSLVRAHPKAHCMCLFYWFPWIG